MIVDRPEVILNEAVYYPDPEDAQMSVQNVTFGVGPAGDIQAKCSMRCVIPPAHIFICTPLPQKKQKIDSHAVDPALNIDAALPPVWSIFLETAKERYLLLLCIHMLFVEYNVLLVLDVEVDEEVVVLEGASVVQDTTWTAVSKDVVNPPSLLPDNNGVVNEKTGFLLMVDANKDKLKQMMLQTLQQNLHEDMFRFAKEDVYVTDMISEEMDVNARTEWIVHVKRWKWGPEGQELSSR
ncbi:hypothetical protein E4T56_gene7267 [Termitomyces sp. T112]|nr:hypothetical protein E4T56_gene7267 [Termitomyces sp. T112]